MRAIGYRTWTDIPYVAEITLNLTDMLTGCDAGYARFRRALAGGFIDSIRQDPPILMLQNSIRGACAEKAFANFIGLKDFDCPDYFKKQPDVGIYNVRSRQTEIRKDYEYDCQISIKERDEGDRPYVLIVGEPPRFRIYGWILGGEGKKEEHLWSEFNGQNAYYVHPDSLNKDFSQFPDHSKIQQSTFAGFCCVCFGHIYPRHCLVPVAERWAHAECAWKKGIWPP